MLPEAAEAIKIADKHLAGKPAERAQPKAIRLLSLLSPLVCATAPPKTVTMLGDHLKAMRSMRGWIGF